MNLKTALAFLAPIALLTSSASAQGVEDFEAGNPDNWRMEFDGTYNGFSIPAIPGTLNPTGGNPGASLDWAQLQSPVNVWHLNNQLSPDWRGDFRAKGIASTSFDFNYQGNSPFGMHMFIVLADDMGTPEITDDILIWTPYDPGVYSFAGFGVALPGGSWHTVQWDIPSASTTLPTGWTVWSHTGTNSGNDDLDWNAVIQDVDYLAVTNFAPWSGATLGFIDISFDNIKLESALIQNSFCSCDGTATAAPCGNTGAAGNGCDNSTAGGGANITADGTGSVANSTVEFTCTGVAAGVSGVFFQGVTQANGGMGNLFGDGLMCAGGPIKRLEVLSADGSGTAVSTVNVAVAGALPAGGATRIYQFWYRDPVGGPCGSGFNTSNALEIVWLP